MGSSLPLRRSLTTLEDLGALSYGVNGARKNAELAVLTSEHFMMWYFCVCNNIFMCASE